MNCKITINKIINAGNIFNYRNPEKSRSNEDQVKV